MLALPSHVAAALIAIMSLPYSEINKFRQSKNQGSLASFSSNSSYAPSVSLTSQRDESYNLLLELCTQEPTLQSCFKIIESTCLARGVDLEMGGKPPSNEFRMFVTRCTFCL